MIKKVLLFISVLSVIVYLVIAVTLFNDKPANLVCRRVDFIIKNCDDQELVTKEEMLEPLKKSGLYPVGKKMSAIQSKLLEKQLKQHPLVKNAECYKTPSGVMHIEITQRTPVLRIMSNSGDNYYIDEKGNIVPSGSNFLVHSAIVTGEVKKSFATQKLYVLGQFIRNDQFWNSQIEQINITSRNELELVPRVGDHLIFLGGIENFEEKLSKLKIFYDKVLNQVGWNKYALINLEFNNQIICTKKEN